MSIESDIWKRKLQMSRKQMMDSKAIKRCYGCKNYFTNSNDAFMCARYNKIFATVTNEECPYDGSERKS